MYENISTNVKLQSRLTVQSKSKFKCFTCDFTCMSHGELVEYNDRYSYSHRITLNKDNEKQILDEFQ